MDSPSKSRVTTTSKERERTDRQRTSPLFFLRTEGTGLRSGQLFRCASCGTAQLTGFGVVSPSKSRVTTSISIESSDIIASSLAQAGRRQSRQDQSERSSDEDEKSWLFQGGVVGRGVGGMSGKLAGRQDELLRALKTSF